MNDSAPKVSVILPSLNVAGYIEECLDSVICQSLKELEIICVDAGSTDGTREILDRYARLDSRIVILQSDRKSYGRQVNMGLDYASGEYIAILETDDWVLPDMYRCLYECGTAERLDYIAADFDMFWQLQNGEYYFIRQHLFGGDRQEWYGKVLDSDELATLRASDYVLWKGIYNKKFLDNHNIRLHESPGAAFQDMGFLQQVKTYEERAIYLDQSFYMYRQSRGNASSGALEGLRYYENEFRWINEELKLPCILQGTHRKYYYFTMSISFMTKYEQLLESLEGEWQDDRLKIPYKWFRNQLGSAIEKGILNETMYGKELWRRMMLLLSSQETHARVMMEHEKTQNKKTFMDKIHHRSAVIFGCGIRGERLMHFCTINRVDIYSFCDNNASLHGGKKFGFPVIDPADLRETTECINGVILLSMEHGREEVHGQLIKLGVDSGRIIDEIPEGVL